MCACLCVCVFHSAFDTLAKVLNPPEAGVITDKCVSETTLQLIGQDQETPIIEVEGPLLTDGHVKFKVGEIKLLNNGYQILSRQGKFICTAHFMYKTI